MDVRLGLLRDPEHEPYARRHTRRGGGSTRSTVTCIASLTFLVIGQKDILKYSRTFKLRSSGAGLEKDHMVGIGGGTSSTTKHQSKPVKMTWDFFALSHTGVLQI
jgi:hypothetical protein